MALFSSVSVKDVDEFAKTLAADVANQYPPALEHQAGGQAPSDGSLTAVLEDVCNKAAMYKNQHKLGVYKKARLGNSFRWELQALGYTTKFIDTATDGLVVCLARKQ